MTAQDDLRILVDETYPETLANLNIILVKLGEAQTELINEIATINDAVLDGAEAAHVAALEAKRIANGWAWTQTYGGYGTSNLTDWAIWDYNGILLSAVGIGAQITYLGPDDFNCGPPFVDFPVGSPINVMPGNITRYVQSTVVSPPDPAPPTSVAVTLTPGPPLPVGLISIEGLSIVYSPTVNWDSDPTIEPHQIAFAVGYDQLTHPIGLTGTYGLLEKKDQIDLGITIQTINRDAYADFITVYEPYAA